MPRNVRRRTFTLSTRERILIALFRAAPPITQHVVAGILAQPVATPLLHEGDTVRRRLERSSRQMGVERPRRSEIRRFAPLLVMP